VFFILALALFHQGQMNIIKTGLYNDA